MGADVDVEEVPWRRPRCRVCLDGNKVEEGNQGVGESLDGTERE